MSIGELAKYTFVSRYSKYQPEKQRRETWDEAVDRVMNMHFNKYGESLVEEIELCRGMMKEKKILGSQRALQFGGLPILIKNAKLYNCCGSFCDRLRFFQECFWLLLCGCGTGFSVQKHHIAKLPEFSSFRHKRQHFDNPIERNNWRKIYVIPDSIEGWADALGILISSYFTEPTEQRFNEYGDCNVEFDYSLIRAKGKPLSSGCGKAPGPEPLRKALETIRQLLEDCLENGQKRLEPINAYDIVMHSSDAVLSGGVRRSATICIFSKDDMKMMTAKTGDWFVKNPQRGRSNNSVLLLRGKTTEEEFNNIIQHTRQYGEPGFYWADSTEVVPNPCVEISFYPIWEWENGRKETGWHFCNLAELNGKLCKSLDDFRQAATSCAILGTLQAGYTDFPYLGEATERICRAEALLGVSITGMMDNADVLFNPLNQREVAKLVLKENERIAKLIGINPTARATCVKPSGTASCILGTASGIHPHHATRYIRRVQSNKSEVPYRHFSKINPIAVEDSVWSVNKTDGVISFCIEVEPGGKVKNQLSAVDMLSIVKSTYENWVLPGTVKKRCLKPWLTHNVSNTVNVKPTEWEEVAKYIYDNRQYFSGVSLLPITGDKDYAQAPFTAVYTPSKMVSHYGEGAVIASGIIERALGAFDHDLWKACDTLLGHRQLVEPEEGHTWINLAVIKDVQEQWLERARKFAERYFDGDLQRMTYCLKDIYSFKMFTDLQREFKEVDYTQMTENGNNVDFTNGGVECGGGSCEMVRV